MSKIQIYTDGACRNNPGPGGWGALLRYNDTEKTLSGCEPETTNNRMEMMAAIQALSSLKRPSTVDLFTDSDYLRKGMTEWLANWKKANWKTKARKPVKNQDLWERLDALVQIHTVEWHWVKAHNGHPENELVDQLARDAIDELEHAKK